MHYYVLLCITMYYYVLLCIRLCITMYHYVMYTAGTIRPYSPICVYGFIWVNLSAAVTHSETADIFANIWANTPIFGLIR